VTAGGDVCSPGTVPSEDGDSESASDWQFTDAEMHSADQLPTCQDLLGAHHAR